MSKKGVKRNKSYYDDLYINFGKNLMILRTSEGLTVHELAKMVDLSPGTITRAEKFYNSSHISFDSIMNICKFFDVWVEDMFVAPKDKNVKKAKKRAKKIDKKNDDFVLHGKEKVSRQQYSVVSKNGGTSFSCKDKDMGGGSE